MMHPSSLLLHQSLANPFIPPFHDDASQLSTVAPLARQPLYSALP